MKNKTPIYAALMLSLSVTFAGCAKQDDSAAEKTEAAAAEAREARAEAREAAREADIARAEAQICSNCGTVVGIAEIKQKGEGSGAGAFMGAVLGGVAGHQFGSGKGNDAATVGGAIAGGVAGHEVEKRVKSTTSYDVTVRMDSGSTRVINSKQAPGLAIGDKVRVDGNTITRS